MIRNLLVAAVLAGSATIANAAQWNFSYVASTGTFTGQFSGTLQGDGNIVFVTGLTGVQLTPSTPPQSFDLLFVDSATNFLSASGATPKLSLDGTVMDLLACSANNTASGCSSPNSALAFVPAGGIDPAPFFISSLDLGNVTEQYNSANWSASAAGPAVPEPSSWAMLIAGFGLTGAAMRRKARRITA